MNDAPPVPAMTPERWQRIERLFTRSLELEGAARAALLEEACRDDPALREAVEAMLRFDDGDDALRQAIGQAAAAAAREADDLWCGRELGAYRIERPLASGGMASVFLARRADAAFEREVAIKLLSSALSSADARRRFLVERQILANLDHPYIAQLLDGGATDDGVPYLVMEYVDGLPIDAWCERENLSVADRLRLFRKVCGAVQYAHRHLVVHRDIKPGNILVTADGTPKLLDFGIAKLLNAAVAPAATAAEARLLTPMHASPEQVRGEPVTTASDVYSLGVLLYELLTGSSPYRGPTRTPREIEQAICETEPLRPSVAVAAGSDPASGAIADAGSDRPADTGAASGAAGARTARDATARRLGKALAGDLDTIVMKALRKEPDRRYAGVDEFAADIDRYLARRPISARPASFAYRARKFLARRAGAVAAVIGVFLLVTALIAFYTVRLAHERDLQARERETAQQVSDFMVGLFEKADPRLGEADLTARELLAQGMQRIGEIGDAQPLVAASLMIGMGRAHGGLGDYDTAFDLVSEALEIRRQWLPSGHPDIAEGLHRLGDAELGRKRYPEARALFEEALAMREQALGPQAVEVGRTLYRLAYVDMRLADYPAMHARLERALAIHEQALGPGHPDTGDVAGLLGSYYWVTGDLDSARVYLARSLASAEQAYGADSIRTVYVVHNLGLLSWNLGEYQAAYDLYRRELATRKKHLGPGHPDLAVAMYGLGITSGNMGNYGEALDWYEQTVALQEAALGPDDHYLAMTLGGYGFTLLDVGRLADAHAALERSLAIFERKFGASHPDLRAPLTGLAKVAIAEGRYADADALMARTRQIVDSQLPADHPDVLRTIVSSGELYAAAGDWETARAYFAQGLEGLERIGLDHPYAAPALSGMAATQTAAGEYGEAETNYLRAIAIHERDGHGDHKPALAAVLDGYAHLLRLTGRTAEAADQAARARRIRAGVTASIADFASSEGD